MRTAVVTGASRGIGLAVAEELEAKGWRVVSVARGRGPHAEHLAGDLSCKRTVREAAERILDACPRIDVLVHNAGIWPAERATNEDGLELAFATNHLAPFLLSHLLEERLAASRARVVQVSAGIAIKGRVDLARTPTGEDFHALRTYATTKLANLMLVPLFAERWASRAITIDAVHPGVIRTALGDRGGASGILLRAVKRAWKAPVEGARPVVRLAIDAPAGSGRWFDGMREVPLPEVARDRALADRVWQQAAELCGVG